MQFFGFSHATVQGLFVAIVLAGCSSFDRLTQIPSPGDPGPSAHQCRHCHQQQYLEWHETAHARAITTRVFLETAGTPAEEECLHCHSPLRSQDHMLQPRSFHPEEGVNCISCHLVAGAMHGPHPSTALISPHPIVEDRVTYTASSFCAPCHEETYVQWQEAAAETSRPTCQSCHQAALQRTASQGTNIFSDILVSFEKKVATRSHDIRLENMTLFPDTVQVTLRYGANGPGERKLEVQLRNNLPHDLPTGTFGRKELRLLLVSGRDGQIVGSEGRLLATEGDAMRSGSRQTIVLPLPKDVAIDTLTLQLIRSSPDDQDRQPIILASFPVPPAQEALAE